MRSLLLVGTGREELNSVCNIFRRCFDSSDIILATLACPPNSSIIGYPVSLPFAPEFNCLYSDFVSLSESTTVVYLNIETENKNNDETLNFASRWLEDRYTSFADKIIDAYLAECMVENVQNYSSFLKAFKAKKNGVGEEYLEFFKAERLRVDDDLNCHYLKWSDYCDKYGYDFYTYSPEKGLDIIESDDKNSSVVTLARFLQNYSKNKTAAKRIDLHHSNKNCYVDNISIENSLSYNREEVVGGGFAMEFSSMGFGDYLIRMELMFDFVNAFTNFKFKNLPYKNPHSTEVDFFSLIEVKEDEDFPEIEKEVTVEIDDFMFILFVRNKLLGNGLFTRIGMGPSRKELIDFSLSNNYPRRFLNQYCRFSKGILEDSPFISSEKLKVVYHLRRHDTIASQFASVLTLAEQKKFMVDRLYLTIDTCDELMSAYLEAKNKQDNSIDIIILSDGVDDLPSRLEGLLPELENDRKQQCLNIITRLNRELLESPTNLSNANISNRLIGRSEDSTVDSIKALASADVVITSSGFSKVLAEISNADVIWAKDAVKLLEQRDNLVKYYKKID